MSATRTDDDLERLLRATLTAQSRTVDYGPSWAGPEHAKPAARIHWRPQVRPRVAVAVAAVIALGLAAMVVVIQLRPGHRTPPATGLPASAFTSFDVAGYPVTTRATMGDGSRSVTVRTPRGDASGDVAVTLWAPHTYKFSPLQHQSVVLVSGHRGYAGTDGFEQYHGRDRALHTVVWEFAPDQWAVAEQVGNIKRVPTPAAILAVARAARPYQHLPLTTTFRLVAVPTGYTLDQVILSSSDVVFLLLHAGRDHSLEFIAQRADRRASPSEPGAAVYRNGAVTVTIVAIGPNGRPGNHALTRQAGSHIAWGTTDLSRIVP